MVLKKHQGLTLTEILIVVVILMILIFAALFAYRIQLGKGRDAKRKADLNKLQKVLEDYYNDNNCYPAGLNQLVSDYLEKLPTDPITRRPYDYFRSDCNIYRLYAKLENTQDPAITKTGCQEGCGPGGGTAGGICTYNYGVCSSNVALESCASCSYSCQGKECNNLSRAEWECPRWFCTSNCEGECHKQELQCQRK